MDITQEEVEKISQATTVFNITSLSREQIEYIIVRKLTKLNAPDKDYSLRNLFIEPKPKTTVIYV